MDQKWVVDATRGWPPCFCPIEGDIQSGDFSVVVGMNYIGAAPPGEVVAVVHQDGQAAVDAFMEEHGEALTAMLSPPSPPEPPQ